mgnify:CR=1 FL=1
MRSCGILMHISSLPSPYGIGTFGAEAEKFADWLKEAGQKYWQVLPIGHTGYGDSPYQPFSSFAGNPLLIDLDELVEHGYLAKKSLDNSDYGADPSYVDFDIVNRHKTALLREAFAGFTDDVGYTSFVIEEQDWLDNYALFMALKDKFGGRPWSDWDDDIKLREPEAVKRWTEELKDDIKFYKFVQYIFYRQWDRFHRYCNKNGIQLIGDIPIYCALDSADVWCQPELFQLDSDRVPTVAAGFPPDAFSADGQLWGNPIYDWDRMKQDNYRWWVGRIGFAKKIYDIVRIDHFIGFNSYYAIPFGSKTAHGGKWCEGPKYDLFRVIKQETGNGGIIAEDLGIITPPVRKLLRQAAYPGMKVLQFAFDPSGDSEYLPQNYKSQNCAVYTSTHDNDTAAGWFNDLDRNTKRFVKEYLGIRKAAELPRAFIDIAWKSTADIAMTTIQELQGFGTEARINVPSTVGNNWRWRTLREDFTDENAEYLNRLTEITNRKPSVKRKNKK